MLASREPALPISDTPGWRSRMSPYQRPAWLRALLELGVTVAPLILFWAAMIAAVRLGIYWLYPVLLVLSAGFLVRLFMVQHDCGHAAFFPHPAANDWTGRVIGVLTLTPYDHWRRSHALHHATSGNLDRRGAGDINTLTVEEYRARSRWGRLCYRLYRHPLVMFGVGPAYIFLFENRLPFGFMRNGWMPWLSTMSTNLGAATLAVGFIVVFGWPTFALTYLAMVLLAAAAGVWLFYVQHQFSSTHWQRRDKWNPSEAALLGSSYYDLPPPLSWISANIGVHHIHHLSSRIPFYRLQEALRAYPELTAIGRLTLWQSLRCPRLALWDEAESRLVPFAALRRSKS